MPVDNTVYDRMAESWWEERGFLHVLAALNPARFGYMRRVLTEELHLGPADLRALDIGCGGGLLAEEFARLGCAVVGVDPSEESLAAARTHAAGQGLAIEYHCARGEALPFPDDSFDIVYCCDVLEHVTDLQPVMAETARVLRPGGTYFYDTINRTPMSRLIVIQLLQEWRWTALMPPRLHDWHMFIRPAELRRALEQHGLVPGGLTGLKPRANPLRLVRTLRQRKRGLLSYAAAVRKMDVRESPDTSVSYIGYARKLGSRPMNGTPLATLLVLGSVLVTPTQTQISQPGATHLDAREVVVSVYPSTLDGVFFEAKVHHKRKWIDFTTRFEPQSVSAWLESVGRLPAASPGQKQRQSPVLAGMGGKEGIVLVVPQKGDRYWLLRRLDDEPLLIRADPKFNDTLLVALRAAVPYSGVDSAAFTSGLVPPLVAEPESCQVRIVSIPPPQYPARLADAQIQGRVEVRYIVEADGRADLTSIEPLWASHAEFIPAVMEALMKGRFRPARLNGKPIRRQVYQGVNFRERGSPAVWH